MATFTPNTVSVEVFRSTRVVAANALEYPLYLVPHNLSVNAVDTFSSLKSIVDFGAATNSALSKLISGTFGGIVKPDLAKIGKMPLTTYTLTVDAIPAEGETISVYAKVNGVEKEISYTIANADTTTLAATGLAAALVAEFDDTVDAKNPAFTDAAGVITVTPAATDPYAMDFGYASVDLSTVQQVPHVSIKATSSATPAATLASVMGVDNNFFFVGATSRDAVEVNALATFAQANDMMYVTSTSDVNVKDPANSSNIALTLQAASMDQTVLTYSAQADFNYPEGAVVGAWAGIKPYQINSLNLRTLKGIVADGLSDQDRQTLAERNVNYYFVENGTSNFYEGWVMTEGTEFADTVRFALWAKLATKSAIFNRLKQRSDSGRAVAYADFGASELKAVIQRDMVDVGVRGGTIATGWTEDNTGQFPVRINLNPKIAMSTRAAQTTANIGNRIWDEVSVDMVYISPIHHVNVNLYVNLNRDPE